MTATRSDRTQLILHAPIPTMLWTLAGPNVFAVATLTAVTFADAWYVGQLGTAALASLALVHPFQVLMQMMSAGAIGGGVTSAVARALGANDTPKASSLMWHAVAIAAAMSLLFALVLGVFPEAIFTLLGAQGEALGGAVAYARIAFGGSIAVWLLYTLSAVLRGMGDTATPARAIALSSLAQICLSGLLTLGWGAIPSFGVIGPAIALVICQGVASLYLLVHLLAGRGQVRLHPSPLRLASATDIMRVGGIGLINSSFMALAVVFVTGFVAQYGTQALAGYGLGARLELMLVPIAFGVGAALTAAVGTNVGAGQFARARRIAWTGASVALVLTGVIGVTAAISPELWMDLFTGDGGAYAYGALYLRIAAPFYGIFGGGQALYFASQGTGRMLLPVLVTGLRFLVVVGVGAMAVSLAWTVSTVFGAVAAGLAIMGVGQALCLFGPGWRSASGQS